MTNGRNSLFQMTTLGHSWWIPDTCRHLHVLIWNSLSRLLIIIPTIVHIGILKIISRPLETPSELNESHSNFYKLISYFIKNVVFQFTPFRGSLKEDLRTETSFH